jgi:hypothetical protein
MSERCRKKLMYTRAKGDPILAAVMADIHRTAVKPPPGFLTREQWAKKWKLKSMEQAWQYLQRAMKIGMLVERRYRVVTKGRLMTMAHYGPSKAS